MFALLVFLLCITHAFATHPDPAKVAEIRKLLGIPDSAESTSFKSFTQPFARSCNLWSDIAHGLGLAELLCHQCKQHPTRHLARYIPTVIQLFHSHTSGGFWNSYVKPSDTILQKVHSMITQDPKAGYAIAEVSFLRKFYEHFPQLFGELQQHNDRCASLNVFRLFFASLE